MRKFFTLCIIICLWASAFGQRRLEIIHTNKMMGDRDLRKLYGNVVFKHKDTYMYCDSAYYFSRLGHFEAYNNIRIVDSTVTVTADSLFYNSKTSIANLRGEVVMSNKDMRLTTKFLDYDSKERIAYYYDGGVIKNPENTLSSKLGTFYVSSNDAYFKTNTEVKGENYTINTDTLRYNTKTEINYFYGPTTIVSNGDVLYTENGWYNSKTGEAEFYKNTKAQSESRYIKSDSLFYNEKTEIGHAYGNVEMKDTAENVILYSQYAYHNGALKKSFLVDSVLMVQVHNGDSLFMNADTLFLETITKEDSTEYNLVKAYHKVRYFKSDIQGVCDSLVYHSLDSTVKMFANPVIWSEENQITGHEITLIIKNEELHRIEIDEKSFVVSQDSPDKFNQMKGTSLTGYVKDNNLHRIDIRNFGETIYFMKDGLDDVGINKATCDSITIYIKENKANQIVFRSNPDGILYPPNELSKDNQKLTDFRWLNHMRPASKNDVFVWINEDDTIEISNDSTENEENETSIEKTKKE